MSKKATKKNGKSKAKKVEMKVASFDVNKKVLATAKTLIAKGDQSKCEVVRTLAKRFGSVRRGEIEATFVKGLRMNLGTVRRQIQEGRA